MAYAVLLTECNRAKLVAALFVQFPNLGYLLICQFRTTLPFAPCAASTGYPIPHVVEYGTKFKMCRFNISSVIARMADHLTRASKAERI